MSEFDVTSSDEMTDTTTGFGAPDDTVAEATPYETADTGLYESRILIQENLDGSVDMLIDADGDGRIDAALHDADGDGNVDVGAIDADGDGALDTVLRDYDDDGQIDQVIADTNQDGRPDVVASDLNGDGRADQVIADTNFDGVPDQVTYLTPGNDPFAAN